MVWTNLVVHMLRFYISHTFQEATNHFGDLEDLKRSLEDFDALKENSHNHLKSWESEPIRRFRNQRTKRLFKERPR